MTSIAKTLVQAKLKAMARKFPPGTLCVYCAEAPATTTDHVPPKGFFAKGHRSDLIRVPACRTCNGLVLSGGRVCPPDLYDGGWR